ncbi:hypothetical protein QTI66_36570 [Variovorax sp. J22R133]|uniref:hypothetical protein n=1 Tax=Variovorax brevis TaxID=3053503 RepID=UPI002576460F|nr:hypothetical protein [Variovorax sp. J22R133]MDM0117628.1 hypothetical protein [Variovorax sp. J22R133]
MSTEYQEYLIERFEGEVEGESFFRALSERAEDTNRKYKWELLAQLETETKEHIRAALKELGLEPAEPRRCIERGQQLAEQLSLMPWLELLKVLRPALQNFVAEFNAAEKLTPPGGRERQLLRHITRHEQALLTFAVREMEERGHASVEAVRALLGKSPLASPGSARSSKPSSPMKSKVTKSVAEALTVRVEKESTTS